MDTGGNLEIQALKVDNAMLTKALNELQVLLEEKNKEISILKERDKLLTCLESAGVDNWSGIDFAYELLQEWEE